MQYRRQLVALYLGMSFDLLFLMTMNTVSRRTLYIILAYLVVAVGLTVIGLKKQYKSMESEPQHNREAGKHSSELKSYEHFYV